MSNIVLTGFMGAGKTVVGGLLARRLGLQLVDCDAVIEKRAGRSVAEIFEADGEAAFRAMEREVIAQASARPGQVIATGGGAVKDERNLANMRSAGPLVCLAAKPEVIWERVARARHRPLLRAPDVRARIAQLLEERAPFYAQADLTVDTSDLPAVQVAEQVLERLGQVRVELGERSYEIAIGARVMRKVGALMRRVVKPNLAVVVTHPELEERYGKRVCASLRSAGIRHVVLAVPPGERSKSFAEAQRLHGRLLEAGADRGSAVVALGGGVIGDLAGFVAATYMRGVSFAQVPTTLLAQVDASVGGKVAVNHQRAKNLVGCFWQPRAVVADLEALRTLPARHFRSGLAEVVKHALIADAALFAFLERFGAQVAEQDPIALQHVVRRNCEIKAGVVAADEREEGLREVLNFGHTIGHALESAGGYRMLHGEAVSVGMVAAARLSCRMGMLAESELERTEALLVAIGLPTRAGSVKVEEVAARMASDKKARSGRLRFVLLERIGKAAHGQAIEQALAMQALAEVARS